MAVSCHVNTKMFLRVLFGFLMVCHISNAWIHSLKLENDDRSRITLTPPFGFLKDGTVAVEVSLFSCNGMDQHKVTNQTFGFTLEKSRSPGLGGYMEGVQACTFLSEKKDDSSAVQFKFDLQNKRLIIDRGIRDLENLTIVDTPRLTYLNQNKLNYNDVPEEEDKTKVSDKGDVAKGPAVAKPSDTSNKADKGAGSKTEDNKKDKTEKAQTADDSDNAGKLLEENDNELDDVDDYDDDDDGDVSDEDDDTGKEGKKTGEKSRRRRAATAAKDSGADAEKKESEKSKTEDTAKAETKTQKPGAVAETPQKGKTEKKENTPPKKSRVISLPLTKKVIGKREVYQTYFLAHIKTDVEEGLYTLIFHNCYIKKCGANLEIKIIQDNNGNFLSADEMPIPALYFVFSIVFFVLTIAYFSVLRRAKEGVYKIHYLMLVVVFFKALSNLFHGINMHMIQMTGVHVDAWAILWYIVYLMRGAVMFVTVLLIGAGWAFIKHVFNDKEKKLFLIVIPLQILLNVAWVIMEESEEGYSSYNTWHAIFIGVDLLCCFVILFPVIWSIRHLQEASKTDGKAAINLNKLKLFRHFYILVVAYIYFTRIIGYLLQMTLPFRYGWMKDLFEEVFLLFFFSLTGYKFRPTMDNPYLQVPQDSDEEDIEMDEVVTKSGATETLLRVNQGKSDTKSATTTLSQRESSHEYD